MTCESQAALLKVKGVFDSNCKAGAPGQACFVEDKSAAPWGKGVISRCVYWKITWKSPDLGPSSTQIAFLQVHKVQPVRQKSRMRGRHVLRLLLEGVTHPSAVAVAALHSLQTFGDPDLLLSPALHTCRRH